MDLLALLLLAIWVMLPAYIPNNVAVLAGGGRPIDGGREWRGKRLLGDGKTWRGTIVGSVAGVLVAVVLNTLNSAASTLLAVQFPTFAIGIVLAFPLGAMLGDIVASFIKRRAGRTRGSAVPLVDQLDFVVLALIVGALVDPAWMFRVFDVALVLVVLILTPILHIGTNILAYVLGLKQEPW